MVKSCMTSSLYSKHLHVYTSMYIHKHSHMSAYIYTFMFKDYGNEVSNHLKPRSKSSNKNKLNKNLEQINMRDLATNTVHNQARWTWQAFQARDSSRKRGHHHSTQQIQTWQTSQTPKGKQGTNRRRQNLHNHKTATILPLFLNSSLPPSTFYPRILTFPHDPHPPQYKITAMWKLNINIIQTPIQKMTQLQQQMCINVQQLYKHCVCGGGGDDGGGSCTNVQLMHSYTNTEIHNAFYKFFYGSFESAK